MLDYKMPDARKWGHSTPTMAGLFAHRVRARELAITHFGGEIAGASHRRC